MSATELLSCPFCGTKPEWVHKVHPSGVPGIKCPHCQFILKSDRRDKVIALWNHRVGGEPNPPVKKGKIKISSSIVETKNGTKYIWKINGKIASIREYRNGEMFMKFIRCIHCAVKFHESTELFMGEHDTFTITCPHCGQGNSR